LVIGERNVRIGQKSQHVLLADAEAQQQIVASAPPLTTTALAPFCRDKRRLARVSCPDGVFCSATRHAPRSMGQKINRSLSIVAETK
jgi:hypothetical protein